MTQPAPELTTLERDSRSAARRLFGRAFLLRMIAEVAHARGMSAQRAIVLAAMVTSVVFGLPNSGKPAQAALLAVTDSGPTLWTGGAFGPEGGLVTLAALVVGAALVLAWLSLRGVPVRAQVRLAE